MNNQAILKDLQPRLLWELFGGICAIPHGSKNEAALAAYLKEKAEAAGHEVIQDETGNLLIKVKATPGYEKVATVVLQGHLDMVCEKNAAVTHDFMEDGIILVRDGDWLKADGTTLGADNGIGVAAGMAVALMPELVHGPVEVLLTVDEETGLTGAMKLDPKNIAGRILLNLDSEETDVVYIGCAGGGGVDATLAFNRCAIPTDWITPRITISGLRGGHSGAQVHEGRANGIKLLAEVLDAVRSLSNFGLVDLRAGDKHNAIPREATAVIAIHENHKEALDEIVIGRMWERFRQQFPGETNLTIGVTYEARAIEPMIPIDQTVKIINLLLSYPSGVLMMNQKMPGLVQTSSTLTNAKFTDKGDFWTHNSPRSSNAGDLASVLAQLTACNDLAGAQNKVEDGYPGWQPNPNSPIVRLISDVHDISFGKKPDVRAIHAGLECGIIGEKFEGTMDMASFGPDIRNPHSPDEQVLIPSVEKFWKLLTGVLNIIAQGNYTG